MGLKNILITIFIPFLLSGCYRYCDKNPITGTGFYLMEYSNDLAGLVKQTITEYQGPIKGNKDSIYKERIKIFLQGKLLGKTDQEQLNILNKMGFKCAGDSNCSASIKYLYKGKCSAFADEESFYMIDTIKISLKNQNEPVVDFFRTKPNGLVIYDVNY